MEDSFEIIIYIIFIALSLLGGLYKNYAKKKAEQQQRQSPPPDIDEVDIHDYHTEPPEEYQPTPKRNPFEEFIRQQLEAAEPEPQPVSVEIEEPEISESKSQKANILLDSSTKEGAAVFKSTSEELVSDNMHEPDFSISDPFIDESSPITDMIADEEIAQVNKVRAEFDLKKAVIYSEILSRPKH